MSEEHFRVWVCFMFAKGAHTLFTNQRERERKREQKERGREAERKRQGERERKRENEKEGERDVKYVQNCYFYY